MLQRDKKPRLTCAITGFSSLGSFRSQSTRKESRFQLQKFGNQSSRESAQVIFEINWNGTNNETKIHNNNNNNNNNIQMFIQGVHHAINGLTGVPVVKKS